MPKDGNGKLKKLDWDIQNMEAFCYPLLFNTGEKGFSTSLKLTTCDYISTKIVHCEDSFLMPSSVYP